ncbi:MAG: hypothetical protein LBU61_01005 [Coriobacteriales bacterium]|jgi:hypothetical protein|nr:hypothetical protein [Coriobacteriales bacterium]
MLCPYCNSELPDDMVFCTDCGKQIDTLDTSFHELGYEVFEVSPYDTEFYNTHPYDASYFDSPPYDAPHYDTPPYDEQPRNTPHYDTPPFETSFDPAATIPQPVIYIQQPKQRSKIPIVIAIVIASILVLGGGGFGGFALVRHISYNKAFEDYRTASIFFENADSISSFRAAEEVYQRASSEFARLGDYQEAKIYSTICSNRVALCQKNTNYIEAMELFNEGKYEEAKEVFRSLSGFNGSWEMVDQCNYYMQLIEAIKLYEQGDYAAALVIFESLNYQGFDKAAENFQIAIYAIANELYQDGNYYEAYKLFKSLKRYQDASRRANACTISFPDSGVYSFNNDFNSSSSDLVIDGSKSPKVYYLKIYDDSTLVACIFVEPRSVVRFNLKPGDYIVKQSTGPVWFGDEIMFGDEGTYYLLESDDGNNALTIEDGYTCTLFLNASGDGNLTAHEINRKEF